MDQPIWRPEPTQSDRSHMRRFMQSLDGSLMRAHDTYAELYRWSIEEPAAFWSALAEYVGVRFSKPPASVLDDGGLMPGARWFSGAELNFAENLLAGADDGCAIVYRDEAGLRREYSRGELRRFTAELAAGFREAGVCPGDRVAVVLPNCPEAVVAALASAAVGAVFTSSSPEFGDAALLERFEQVEPKVLIACDGYRYKGAMTDCLPRFEKIASRIASVEQFIIVPVLNPDMQASRVGPYTLFHDALLKGAQPEYVQLPFDHPLYILYSSGTTGQPKCIVHGSGGTLLQHLKELMLHTNLFAGDTICYYTTCGWMMWNWLISALAVKATVVLYSGSPFYPDPQTLWRLVAKEGINILGVSPRFLGEYEKSGLNMPVSNASGALRTILSTGAPLPASSYDFIDEQFAGQVQLSSISGGTDIISCFGLGNPLLPVWRGEIQCCGLGMAVEVFNDAGRSVRDHMGELVCVKPFPSMPLYFWNDPDGAAYREAYFSRFAGVWTHGDLAELTEHNGLVIHGRSDAVLNPGGIRIGTAEVCGPAQTLAEVTDSIAIDQYWQNDTRIVLFVVLRDGLQLNVDMKKRIAAVIRAASSPRHVPAYILQVPEIPRTLSGKAVELAVRAVVAGEPVTHLQSIANPEALEYFRNCPELL